MRVVPILLRPCIWNVTPLIRLRCLPRNGKAVTTWGEQMDQAFLDIAQGLYEIIQILFMAASPLSEEEQQERSRIIEKLYATWIEGVLKASLPQKPALNLQFQDQPDMLKDPWKLKTWSFQIQDFNQAPRQLPEDTTIVQIYDASDAELLILGEPGAGKTTLLLQLARELLQRARESVAYPVPLTAATIRSMRKLIPKVQILFPSLIVTPSARINESVNIVWLLCVCTPCQDRFSIGNLPSHQGRPFCRLLALVGGDPCAEVKWTLLSRQEEGQF